MPNDMKFMCSFFFARSSPHTNIKFYIIIIDVFACSTTSENLLFSDNCLCGKILNRYGTFVGMTTASSWRNLFQMEAHRQPRRQKTSPFTCSLDVFLNAIQLRLANLWIFSIETLAEIFQRWSQLVKINRSLNLPVDNTSNFACKTEAKCAKITFGW